jgi:histone-lysine N-methyltransferase SETD3
VQQAAKQGLSAKQWLAARLRRAEKKILSDTMDAVRQRLAPIRGIPTKGGGMQVRRPQRLRRLGWAGAAGP